MATPANNVGFPVAIRDLGNFSVVSIFHSWCESITALLAIYNGDLLPVMDSTRSGPASTAPAADIRAGDSLNGNISFFLCLGTDGAAASVVRSCRARPGSGLREGDLRASWLALGGYYAACTKHAQRIAYGKLDTRKTSLAEDAVSYPNEMDGPRHQFDAMGKPVTDERYDDIVKTLPSEYQLVMNKGRTGEGFGPGKIWATKHTLYVERLIAASSSSSFAGPGAAMQAAAVDVRCVCCQQPATASMPARPNHEVSLGKRRLDKPAFTRAAAGSASGVLSIALNLRRRRVQGSQAGGGWQGKRGHHPRPTAALATSCSISLSLSAAWAFLPSAPAPAPVIYLGELFLPEGLFAGLGGTSPAVAGEPSAMASNAVEKSLACGGSLTWLVDSGTTGHFFDGVLVLCIAT